MKNDRRWMTYLVRCDDNSLYAGATDNVPARIRKHLAGKGSKYVRSRLPAHLAWAQRSSSKSAALKREAALKKMSKKEKEEVILKANPLLRFWLECDGDVDRRMEAVDEWAWAVPSEEALGELVSLSPIVEIGAGTGYWAHMLQKMGADVTAYDVSPPDISPCNPWHPGSKMTHTSVKTGDERMVIEHPGSTLLLCWPPRGGMAAKCVRNYRGDVVAIVGEPRSPTCGNEDLWNVLDREFILSGVISVPQWDGVNDMLQTWRRR